MLCCVCLGVLCVGVDVWFGYVLSCCAIVCGCWCLLCVCAVVVVVVVDAVCV